MYTEAARYDLRYPSMTDDSAEAGQVADLIRRARPHRRTLLGVGCGTGDHARYLSEIHRVEVDGVGDRVAALRRAASRSASRA